MPREEALKAPPMPHGITLSERAKADITGVRQVLLFDENEVSLKTDAGELLLTGEKLHVTHLLLEEGKLSLEGRVDSIQYTERQPRRGLFSRR